MVIADFATMSDCPLSAFFSDTAGFFVVMTGGISILDCPLLTGLPEIAGFWAFIEGCLKTTECP
jgi:hypothetical protein